MFPAAAANQGDNAASAKYRNEVVKYVEGSFLLFYPALTGVIAADLPNHMFSSFFSLGNK